MKILCSWCFPGATYEDQTSHGICPACEAKMREEVAKIKTAKDKKSKKKGGDKK